MLSDEQLAEMRRKIAEAKQNWDAGGNSWNYEYLTDVSALLAEVERQQRCAGTLVEIISGLANSYLTRDGIKRVFEEVDKAQTLDDLRFDIEWICPDCGSVLSQYAVANPGVSWRKCPHCGGRMPLRMTPTNLAINQDKDQ